MVEHLNPLALGWLSGKERATLVGPKTPEEVLEAIKSFPAGKSPGPDGLPIEFYRMYGNLLAPILASLYLHCLKSGELPPSMYHAHVVLIHKPPKKTPPWVPPIALLNLDFKILTKLFTLRI